MLHIPRVCIEIKPTVLNCPHVHINSCSSTVILLLSTIASSAQIPLVRGLLLYFLLLFPVTLKLFTITSALLPASAFYCAGLFNLRCVQQSLAAGCLPHALKDLKAQILSQTTVCSRTAPEIQMKVGTQPGGTLSKGFHLKGHRQTATS